MARPKKRGVKPGTKRGPYKKADVKVLNPSDFKSVGTLSPLIEDLAISISKLESQLTAQIDRIKSILV